MGQAAAVAGVVQAGVGLIGGGGGGGTQYVPNYSAMNEVQLASIDLLSRNYDAQSQLNEQAFQNNIGLQDAEYKRLITQLVYDQAAQQQSLLSQAYQAQAATNVAETSLDLQRLQQVYERGAKEVAVKAEFANLTDKVEGERELRNLTNSLVNKDYELKLNEAQAQIRDSRRMRDIEQSGERLQRQLLASEYAGLSVQERQVLADELLQQERLTGELTGLSQQKAGLDNQEAGIKTQASQQRENLMSQFLEKARGQELGNANQLARMSSSGLVNSDVSMARQQMGQALNPIDQMKRELGLNQANTDEALALAGTTNNRAYTAQLEQAALRGDVIAQQQLQNARASLGVQQGQLDTRGNQMTLGSQQAGLQYDANQRGLQNQYGSLMNSMYIDAIQNGLAPELAAQLAMRQGQQGLNLQQGSANVRGMVEDYGYDIGKAGLNYSRAQDAQSLVDYQRMIQSQGNLNLSAAEAQYMSGLQSGYAQQAANQSQLASGASAGINNAASNIRGATMVDQPASQGFNWAGLGNLARAGVGLVSGMGGGNTTQAATPQQNMTPYNPFPYSGYK